MVKSSPVPYPASAGQTIKDAKFGCVIEGIADINNLTGEEFEDVNKLLHEHGVVVFPNVDLTPRGQFLLINHFDPQAQSYGHGTVGRPDNKSILHPDLRNIPSEPAVQLIGNGPISDAHIAQGLPTPVALKHPSHQSFHKDTISDEDSAKGFTRFYRWHIDAALYNLDPPKVTALYGLKMPTASRQTVRYDDGTGDELDVPLGGTSFVSGKVMFDLLSPELKSLAVRCKVQYAPHPYVWMSTAKALPTGLGMVSEGKELPRDELPPWEASKIKVFPMLWKNPVTGNLHLQVHPSGVESLIIDPVPAGTKVTSDTLYPKGTHITDLKEARDLLYKIQRPGIAPEHVYTHDWKPKDLALFHNRGVLHTITGAFKPEEQRAFWQANLASTDVPLGPSEEDLKLYA